MNREIKTKVIINGHVINYGYHSRKFQIAAILELASDSLGLNENNNLPKMFDFLSFVHGRIVGF